MKIKKLKIEKNFKNAIERYKLGRYIGSSARDGIWEDAIMTQSSEDARNSYVTEEYWKKRVKPTFLTFLQKLYNNRDDLLPELSKEQIYLIAAKTRKPFEQTIRKIVSIWEDRLIISPAVALMYGVKDGEMIKFSSDRPYGGILKKVEVEPFTNNAEFYVKLHSETIKTIYGLSDTPSGTFEGKYKIEKMVPEIDIKKEETIS